MNTSTLSKIRSVIATVIALAIGGAAGAGVALLYAPQSGRVTRSKLLSKGEALREKVVDDVALTKMHVQNQVNHANRVARIRAYELGNQLQHSIEDKQAALKEKVSELPIPMFNGHSH